MAVQANETKSLLMVPMDKNFHSKMSVFRLFYFHKVFSLEDYFK